MAVLNRLWHLSIMAWMGTILVFSNAHALPGHSMQQEKYWANHNEFLLDLEEIKAGNQKTYVSKRKTSNGTEIYFVASINPKLADVVLSEAIWIVPTEKSVPLAQRGDYFLQNHKKMFEALLMTIYNAVVIRDDYLAAESDFQPDKMAYRAYYRGRKYGYMLEYSADKPSDCIGQCPKGAFQLNIFDIANYDVKVKAERNRKKEQPVNIHLFP